VEIGGFVVVGCMASSEGTNLLVPSVNDHGYPFELGQIQGVDKVYTLDDMVCMLVMFSQLLTVHLSTRHNNKRRFIQYTHQ
jgi:hypothetical protein